MYYSNSTLPGISEMGLDIIGEATGRSKQEGILIPRVQKKTNQSHHV